ncbi:MAG: radical SAM protein [Vicinamibacterales bacterium]
MRICLATRHAEPSFTPLSLLYLRAFLIEREGWAPGDVQMAEFYPDTPGDQIAAHLLRTGADLVGLSCYVWNITALMEAARLVRAARPHAMIAIGGPEVGPIAREVLAAHPAVDVVVRSEGEVPFGAIARARRDGASLDEIPGITFRRDGAIVETSDAPILKSLDSLPSPHKPEYGDFDGRTVCIETQRGCVFRCTFCFYNKDLSIRNRRFDLDRVKGEIRSWLDRRPAYIYLMDPIFNLNAERAKAICRFIAEHNTAGVPFHAEIWAEFVDEELAALFKAANFRFLEVGLQTTDQGALAAVERRLKLQPFLDGIRFLTQYDLPFELQLIHGLPDETPASFRQSLDFAASLDPPHLAAFPLMVLPGTELWRTATALGLEYDPDPPYLVRSHPAMDEAEMAWGRRMSDAVEVIGQARTFRLLAREPGVGLRTVVEAWMARHPVEPPAGNRHAEMLAFVPAFCREHGIPTKFYEGFAAWEFGGR